MKLLVLLVVVIGLIAIVQLAKVYQLTASLRTRREEDISEADNRLNGGLFLAFMVLFYASFIWLVVRYGDYALPSASLHGEAVDQLMDFNMAIIFAVFFLVNTLLFWFSAKYYYRADRKARFFAHDNRLELVWTVIPSIVLAVIIAYGLSTWNDMTGEPAEDALRVEVYSKQFDWTVRYPGNDGEFGLSNYNLITPTNPLGLVTEEGLEASLTEIEQSIAKLENELSHERGHLLAEQAMLQALLSGSDDHGHDGHADHGDHGHDGHADHGDHGHDGHADHGDHGHDGHADHGDHGHDDHADHGDHGHGGVDHAAIEARLHAIEAMLEDGASLTILTEAAYEAKEDKLNRLKRHRQRLMEISEFNYDGGLSAWSAGNDDQIVKGEFHLPVGREVEMVFRSRDVIHSAYMPQFRAQMNTVPGVPTRFKMTPTITTDSMRQITGDTDFDYVLLCNKVCGAAHFNMQMKLVVETQEEYDAWIKEQKEYLVKEEAEEEDPEVVGSASSEESSEQITASL